MYLFSQFPGPRYFWLKQNKPNNLISSHYCEQLTLNRKIGIKKVKNTHCFLSTKCFPKHLFLSCYFSPCSILHALHTFQKVPNKWIFMKMFIIIVTHWICLIKLLLSKHWSNPYATHLFNSSLNVKRMHCTDGGTTDVIPNWCSCFFCSFSSSGLNSCFPHQTVGQLYQILT